MQSVSASAWSAIAHGRMWVVIADGHAHLCMADGSGDVAGITLDAITTGLVRRSLAALDRSTPGRVAFPFGEADHPHVDRVTAS